MTTTVEKYFDICAGHRVVGHEGKCKNLHGHNYRVHVKAEANSNKLDELGMVIDFSVLNFMGKWLEDKWDHRMLLWYNDPVVRYLQSEAFESIVTTPFNPTAENMAEYLLNEVSPFIFRDYAITIVEIKIEETRKCTATVKL